MVSVRHAEFLGGAGQTLLGHRVCPAPAWLTGLVERLFFTIIVAVDLSGIAIAMLAWLGLKLAINWNRLGIDLGVEHSEILRARFGFSAALAGLVSMIFALIGGLICQLRLPT